LQSLPKTGLVMVCIGLIRSRRTTKNRSLHFVKTNKAYFRLMRAILTDNDYHGSSASEPGPDLNPIGPCSVKMWGPALT